MRKGIYKSSDGKWYISTKIKVNGDYHTCTIRGFNSKKEADDNYDYEIDKWKRSHHFYTNENLFEATLQEFYEYRAKQLRADSLKKTKSQFNTYWCIIFKNQPLTTIFNVNRLKIIYNDIVKNKDFNDRKKSNLVKSFLEYSHFCYLTKRISNEMYEDIRIIYQRIKVSKIVQNEKRVVPQNEMEKFFNAIDHTNKDYVMFKLFTYTGTRISEFLGLCVDCFDRTNNKIKIKRQLLTNGKLTDTLKTSNSYREIPLNDEIANLTSVYIDNNNLKQGRLFKLSHTDFKRKLKHYEREANIPLYSSHEIGRHTKCYQMAMKCETISDVVYCAKTMGHSVNIYLSTYCSHLDNSIAKKFL